MKESGVQEVAAREVPDSTGDLKFRGRGGQEVQITRASHEVQIETSSPESPEKRWLHASEAKVAHGEGRDRSGSHVMRKYDRDGDGLC